MEPITTTIATLLIRELVKVTVGIWDEGKVAVPLEPVKKGLDRLVQRYLHEKIGADRDLLDCFRSSLAAAGAPTGNEEDLQRWLKAVSLDRLAAKKNSSLRRQVARGVLGFTDPGADPPEDLVRALGWPRTRRGELAALLSTLRAGLFTLPDWQASIDYANQVAELGLLGGILDKLARLDNVYLETESGAALRVYVVQQGLTRDEAAQIEERYRGDLVRDLRMHDFRGIVQMRKDIRLPLADIYLEPGLLSWGDEDERSRARERMLSLRGAERLAEEEQRLRERVTDGLSRSQRLVIVGEPGSGKTMSLRFIALMLAYGHGAARLGLEVPYIPVMVRLADFARALEQRPALSLNVFIPEVMNQSHASQPRLGEFLNWAMEKGACVILLDGLDEVGDDPVSGRSLRTRVVQRVQQLSDMWCSGDRCNRLVVTSRIEGYWNEPLRGFDHVQISPLRPPEEVQEFLLRWFAAHEQAHDPALPAEEAERRAEERVADLLPSLMEVPSVRRLATNPLLLTILALIYQNVGKLPNRRIKLYEICAQTLIESWRQVQTGLPSRLLAELGEETVIRIMAPLAYWLHQEHPGGTTSFENWRERLLKILVEQEGYEKSEATDIAHRFLHHARFETGLLAERGLGQFGFFHLTFEEYLAAREMARQRLEKRRQMLQEHWYDPRWQEVILLAAGQLGIVEAREGDVSDCLEDLMQMEPVDAENQGRQVVLAGRALADIGPRSVTRRTRRWVLDALREVMQDLHSETQQPRVSPLISIRNRYAAGEVLDELGWLPDDLHTWIPCTGCAGDGRDLLMMKFPVTNAQFERFILAGGYRDPTYWGGEGSDGWRWAGSPPSWRGAGPVQEPEYWHDPRFGMERRGYPVVGVSWYEAAAYGTWLTSILRRWRAGEPDLPPEDLRLVAGLQNPAGDEVRLPTAGEWQQLAGGVDHERYPWDAPGGPATGDEAAIRARANTSESGIGGTSPVAMYPLGSSQPFGIADLAGNVYEWTDPGGDENKDVRELRGGSWNHDVEFARCAFRRGDVPRGSGYGVGFRLVSPVVSGS